MKTLVTCLAAAMLGYSGYRYYSEHYLPAPTVVLVTPTPAGPRLAPEGTYFLLDYFGVRTERGVTGWTPGQQVKAVASQNSDADKRWVSDGTVQAQVDDSLLTRDIDLAARLVSTDGATQAAAARQALAARDAQKAQEKREQADAAEAAQKQAARQRTRTVHAPASTPSNPLERSAVPTNGGRQVSSAPDISNVRVVTQSNQNR